MSGGKRVDLGSEYKKEVRTGIRTRERKGWGGRWTQRRVKPWSRGP